MNKRQRLKLRPTRAMTRLAINLTTVIGLIGATGTIGAKNKIPLHSSRHVLLQIQSSVPELNIATFSPRTFPINTPTTITLTAVITDTSSIPPGGVFLLRKLLPHLPPSPGDETCKNTGICGQLHDDGMKGDAVAGDKIYTVQVTFTENFPTEIQLQLSSVVSSHPDQTLSSTVSVFAQSLNTVADTLLMTATDLESGDINAVLKHFSSSSKNSDILPRLTSQDRARLAALLRTSQLVTSKPELRVYRSNLTLSDGSVTDVEFTLVPVAQGQWVISDW